MADTRSTARPEAAASDPGETGLKGPAPASADRGPQDRPSTPGEHARARHGTPSEVSWDGGQGRQPYENQDPALPEDPAAADVPEGNRGEASGRNLDDIEKTREHWPDPP